MANVNPFNPLSPVEDEAYKKIAEALSGLTDSSRHKVLKELAWRLGREVVQPGAVRAAAASAASRSLIATTGPAQSAGRGKGRSGGRGKATDPEYKAWAEDDTGGAPLIKARDAIIMDNPPTPKQLAERTAASKLIREAYECFRTGGGNPLQNSKGPKGPPSPKHPIGTASGSKSKGKAPA
jgi:hypothetical protein